MGGSGGGCAGRLARDEIRHAHMLPVGREGLGMERVVRTMKSAENGCIEEENVLDYKGF